MDYVGAFLNLLQWAADKGLINAAQALGFACFIWVQLSSAKTHRESVQHIVEAHDRTIAAKDKQIEEQKEDKRKCEERYGLLRIDVTEMQKQVNEQAKWLLMARFGEESDGSHP